MTPKEKKEAAEKVLDDTMTVSQAKKRKLDLRAKDLQIRAGSLKRKQKNDADAKARRAKASADKDAKDKESRSDKKASEVVSSIRKRKERQAAAEKGKADKLKGIADKRKVGVKKSLSRAKEMAKKAKSNSVITKDEGEASAELKLQKDTVKSTVAGARAGLNVAKAAAKGIGAGIAGVRSKRAQGKVDSRQKKIDDRNEKIDKARDKKVGDRLNRRRMSKLGKLNPFRAKSDGDSKSASSSSDKASKPAGDSPKTKSAAKVEKKPEVKTPTKSSATKDPLKKAAPDVKEPKKPTKSSAAKDPLAKAAGKKPVDQKIEKVKVKVEEPKKVEGSKRLAVKRAASKVKDVAKKAANNPEVRKAAKSAGKAVARKAVSKLSDKKVQPARKALPSGQKALPPSGGVNKPKPQAKSTAGAGNMSDAERARKDPAYRKKLIQQRSQGMNEEFYEYLMEIERMEKKTDKVIDIMKGKNKIEISPKISEEVTGGVSIQDAANYTPLEIETADIITPKKLNHCDWRNEMFDLEGEEDIEEIFGGLVSGLKGAVKSGATALAKNPTVQKGVSAVKSGATELAKNPTVQKGVNAVRDVKRSLLPDVANSNSPLVRSGAQSRQSASNLFGPPKTTSATSSGGAALKSKPFKGPGGDPSGSGSGQAQQGTSRPVSPPKNQGTGERSAAANDARQQAAKLANRNKTSSSTPPSRTTSTLASKSAPSKPAAPARDRMAGASKADRMDAWAKANPKLAAAKAKRDATRGTSATSNPMLQKSKSRMPEPAVGAAATQKEEVEQLDELLGTAARMAGKAIAKTGAKNAAKKKVVRAGIKAGGKRGGRAAQSGLKAGSRQAGKAGEIKNDKSKGMGEKIGGVVGDVTGSLIGGGAGLVSGPGAIATGVAGGLAGEKVGSKIGKMFDKKKKKIQVKKKSEVKEEASDAMKDRELERGGMGARRRPQKPISNTPNTFGKKKPSAGGPSAMDIVKAKIRAQYGDKAIIDTKKEHYDWRSEMGIVEEEGKKDACYKKVKASAKVWPSAYASGRLVQCRKKGAANYGNSKSK